MADLILPTSLTGKKELITLQRELENLAEEVIQARVVSKEIGKIKDMTKLSDMASELIRLNDIKIEPNSIAPLIEQLQEVRNKAPMLRMSFAAEPDKDSIAKIVSWFRKEISPSVLLQVGIQPSIAGGCIVQTPGARYDFSLRKQILGGADKFKAVLAKEVYNQGAPEVPSKPVEVAQEAAA